MPLKIKKEFIKFINLDGRCINHITLIFLKWGEVHE